MAGHEIQRWADEAMYKSEPMPQAQPRVYLVSATPDPLGAVAAAAAMYEGKVVRNLSEVTDDMRKHYWEDVQKTHLTAPLEFIDFHFMIEGVTRAFTHQMVRQRTAVYTQESLRFAVKEDWAKDVPDPPSFFTGELPEKDRAEATWDAALKGIEESYETLIRMGVPAEDARGLLPHSVTTRLNYKTNLRNLIDHAGNRLCTQAQFEWRWVFNELLRSVREYQPTKEIMLINSPVELRTEGDLKNDESIKVIASQGQQVKVIDHQWQFKMIAESALFKPVCFRMGKCPFKADFDRNCSIRDRMDSGRANEVQDAEWALDPTAARKSQQ